MAFFQGPVPGHFAILQAKIGLKMAEVDCCQNWLNLDNLKRSKFEGAPPFNECLQIPDFHSLMPLH